MKRLILMISLLLVLIGASIWECYYLDQAFNYLNTSINTLLQTMQQNEDNIDTQNNIQYIQNLHKTWHKKVKYLKTFVWHSGLKDIEIGISRATAYTEENNFVEVKAELSSVLDFANHYQKDFDILFENIF